MRAPTLSPVTSSSASVSSPDACGDPFGQEPQNDRDVPVSTSNLPAGQSAPSDQGPGAFPDPPPILTIEELATYLRLNHKTIRDAIGRGDIPGVRRFGGAVRIHRDTVVSWLASGQGRVVGSRRTR
jgi:excisionase family DNA binding protein